MGLVMKTDDIISVLVARSFAEEAGEARWDLVGESIGRCGCNR